MDVSELPVSVKISRSATANEIKTRALAPTRARKSANMVSANMVSANIYCTTTATTNNNNNNNNDNNNNNTIHIVYNTNTYTMLCVYIYIYMYMYTNGFCGPDFCRPETR